VEPSEFEMAAQLDAVDDARFVEHIGRRAQNFHSPITHDARPMTFHH
jgi:hypothetical protein